MENISLYRYTEEQIRHDLGKGKIVILYGARQTGKTTIIKRFLNDRKSVYYNCDQEATKTAFESNNLAELSSLVSNYDLIIIDEAQRVKNIGLSLKILIDNFKSKDFIVTGSSSLELSNTISEPLTGRFFSHTLYPVGEIELSHHFDPTYQKERLDDRLIYGSYPEVILTSDKNDKKRIIENISANYLFKDVLNLEIIKNAENLKKLLQAVALQLGGEVSLNELANMLDIDKNTVKKYLEVCQKPFILFSLPPYHRNQRAVISKQKKYYFYDLGIRNALINNFNPLGIRSDAGGLWENYAIIERLKYNASRFYSPTCYFWRSYQKQEIDFIEDNAGILTGFEMKWGNGIISKNIKNMFTDELKGEKLNVVRRDGYEKILFGK